MIEVPEEILIYAFRYVLGRFFHSPYDVVPVLIKNKNKISKGYRKVIATEIEWFLKSEGYHPEDLVELWKNVKIEMERED